MRKKNLGMVIGTLVLIGWLSVIFVPTPIGTLLAFVTYFAGQQTQATVTSLNQQVDIDEIRDIATYTDASGHPHDVIISGGPHRLGQHITVSYLPFFPSFNVVREQVEQEWWFDLLIDLICGAVIYFFLLPLIRSLPKLARDP